MEGFTLNKNLIPALRQEGIRFQYIDSVDNPMKITVICNYKAICSVEVIQEVLTPYCYKVTWIRDRDIICFPIKYKHATTLIDDIKKAIKRLENTGGLNMKIRVESVDMELNTASMINGPVGSDYTIKVNVDGFDPFFSRRVREAIESINNERYIYYGGRGNGKTSMYYDYNGGFTTWRNEYQKERDKFDIKDVIFNDPATIVLWADGTKTVVKAENEPFDPEKGLAMAIAKKALGNSYDYYDTFKKYVGRYEKKQKKGDK